MRVIAFTSIRDNDMMNRQMRKNDAYHAAVRARDEAKSAQKAAAAERRRLRNVTVDEVDRALRAAWEQYSGEFYLDGTTFGKVKTLRCRKAKALIACKVGITATSANGPEYEEVELNSTRIEGGTLQYYSDDIVM